MCVYVFKGSYKDGIVRKGGTIVEQLEVSESDMKERK